MATPRPQVTHQKPTDLTASYADDLSIDYDPAVTVNTVITEPITQPMSPAVPVKITYKSQDILPSIEPLIETAVLGQISTSDQQHLRSILQQCLIHYDASPTIPINELFVAQAASQLKLPAPSSAVRYTAATDVIPAAKTLISGGDPQEFFASLGYSYHPQTLGVWFRDKTAFADFQTWAAQEVQNLNAQGLVDQNAMRLMGQFGSLNLKGLTESLLLRKDSQSALQPGSFPRVLVHLITSYIAAQSAGQTPAAQPNVPDVGLMPFSTTELVLPQSIVFASAEAHARSTPARVNKVWTEIVASLAMPVKMVSLKNISKLTTMHRKMQQINTSGQGQKQTARSAQVVFRKKEPSKVQIIAGVKRALKRMAKVSNSQNIYKRQVRSFARASRRDPSGLNSPGISTRIAYFPDIHIYLDTSGSIHETHYQDAILMLIKLAKKLDVNLYFNSFSDVLSAPVLLKTKGRSEAAIYREFTRVPKVTGGTNFDQIWTYIQASSKRRKEFSLMITDFAWTPRSTYADHPKNLYYAPVSNFGWDNIKHYVKGFVHSMQHIEPAIAHRLIGVYA